MAFELSQALQELEDQQAGYSHYGLVNRIRTELDFRITIGGSPGDPRGSGGGTPA